jgi:hypothetical protein
MGSASPKAFFECGGRCTIPDKTAIRWSHAMRLFRIVGLGFACLLTFCLANGESIGTEPWPTFKGAWFEIKYPPGFKIKPGQKSSTVTPGYDSAYFISPDGTVVFYVFSPQWRGQLRETDIEIDPRREEVIEHNIAKKQDQAENYRIIRTFVVKAKDNRYLRAIRDESTETTRLIFGIKYNNKAAYERYFNDYILFKKSLRQFAD